MTNKNQLNEHEIIFRILFNVAGDSCLFSIYALINWPTLHYSLFHSFLLTCWSCSLLIRFLALMVLNAVKKWLEGGDDASKERLAIEEHEEASPCKFFDVFIMKGIIVDRIEHGRVLCSMKVTPRLTNVSTIISALLLFLRKHESQCAKN